MQHIVLIFVAVMASLGLRAQEDLFVFNGAFWLGEVSEFNLTFVPEGHTKWVALGTSFHGLKLLEYNADSRQLLVSWDEQNFLISPKQASKVFEAHETGWDQPKDLQNISWKMPAFDALPLSTQLDYIDNFDQESITEIEEVIEFQQKRNDVLGKVDKFMRAYARLEQRNGNDYAAMEFERLTKRLSEPLDE